MSNSIRYDTRGDYHTCLDCDVNDLVEQSYSYSTYSLHSLTLVLFEKYTALLETEFSQKLDSVSFIYTLISHLSRARFLLGCAQ